MVFAEDRIVWVILGMRGTVISRARALYRRICEVALKSPWGSAVTIITAFWGLHRTEVEYDVVEGNELEKSSSVSLHCLNGTTFGWDRVSIATQEVLRLGGNLPSPCSPNRFASVGTVPDT